MGIHHNFADAEGFAQDLDALLRLSIPAHEDVESCIISLGPAVNGDVALRQDGYARHPALRREVVQMRVQKGCPRCVRAPLERTCNVLDVIESTTTEQVHQKVSSCVPDPVTLNETVFPIVVRYNRCRHTMIFLLGGA